MYSDCFQFGFVARISCIVVAGGSESSSIEVLIGNQTIKALPKLPKPNIERHRTLSFRMVSKYL